MQLARRVVAEIKKNKKPWWMIQEHLWVSLEMLQRFFFVLFLFHFNTTTVKWCAHSCSPERIWNRLRNVRLCGDSCSLETAKSFDFHFHVSTLQSCSLVWIVQSCSPPDQVTLCVFIACAISEIVLRSKRRKKVSSGNWRSSFNLSFVIEANE